MSGSSKTSWPELLGKPADAAKQTIERERPDVEVILLPAGADVTTDFNPKRVRVFFNQYQNVAEVPKIG